MSVALYSCKSQCTKKGTQFCACMPRVQSFAHELQSCLTLGNIMDRSPPGFSVLGILRGQILEWVPCPSPGDLPNPGIKPVSLTSPVLAGRFFTTSTTWETLRLLKYCPCCIYRTIKSKCKQDSLCSVKSLQIKPPLVLSYFMNLGQCTQLDLQECLEFR